MPERRQACSWRVRQRVTAKAGRHRNRGHDDQRAEHRQHATPTEKVTDNAGEGSAQQIAGHGARQRSPDRDLALLGTDEIAGEAERDRKHAAGADPGKNARREQQGERGRHRAQDVGETEQHQAADHQPRLAEQVGRGPDHRLHDRKGEREHGRETRSRRNAHPEIVGDVRQDRIERAGRQARRKGRERNDVEGWRQTLLLRPQSPVRHQRTTF